MKEDDVFKLVDRAILDMIKRGHPFMESLLQMRCFCVKQRMKGLQKYGTPLLVSDKVRTAFAEPPLAHPGVMAEGFIDDPLNQEACSRMEGDANEEAADLTQYMVQALHQGTPPEQLFDLLHTAIAVLKQACKNMEKPDV